MQQSNRKDKLPEAVIVSLAALSIVAIAFIFGFVFQKAWPVLRESGLGLFTNSNFDTKIQDAFYSSESNPTLDFGMFGVIAGTFVTTGLSLLVATILGIGGAVTICEFSPAPLRVALTAIIRLLASIPSVVFGLLGVIAVVPWISDTFVNTQMQIKFLSEFQITGSSLLASTIVLTFMIVPTVISLSIDAISAIPRHYKETGFAFGMSHCRVIWKIILPSARSGILASVILAAGRGIGEAIAVAMVCGGVGITPDFTRGFVSLLAPVLPLSAAIVNKSEAMSAAPVQAALFACAALLLVMGALLSIGARIVERQMRKVAGHES